MNRQAFIFLGVALAFGLAAAFSARSWLESQAPGPTARVETVPVVVTRIDVPVGVGLKNLQLELVEWPAAYAPAGSFREVAALEGRVPRRPLAAGEPLLDATLLPQGADAGLVAVIDADHRAISVKVDAVIGVAGFVKPGDRVDVIATLRRIDLKEKLPYTKSILQDVRVLAVDQKLEEVANGDPELVSVVTLEVVPEQAEKLTYISHEGRLQLALRGPGDHEMVKTKSVGVSDLLPPRHRKRSKAPGSRVQILKGTVQESRNF
jgi:pilus assembly protein CpaB